jgi:hypothetical protein
MGGAWNWLRIVSSDVLGISNVETLGSANTVLNGWTMQIWKHVL